jgi:glucan phosphoethanolaminetransferase (alkaline phosphatase superfamily)
MPHVFASLAVANLVLFAFSTAFALSSAASARDRHILLAVFSLLLSCFIQVLVFTYLTVTGKVIAQAVHLARLDPGILTRAREAKRSFTHCLAIIVAAVVLLSATGGAVWHSQRALAVHVPVAILAVILHAWLYRKQHVFVRRNAQLLTATLRAYSMWREHRRGFAGTHSAPSSGEVDASRTAIADAGGRESPSR